MKILGMLISFALGMIIGAGGIFLAMVIVEEEDEGDESDGEISQLIYDPSISVTDFVSGIDNIYMPWSTGSKWVYEGETEVGLERIEVTVLNETKDVMGVVCIVVLDVVLLDGSIIESTVDWYAQDRTGNVWYFGEDTSTIENGEVVSKAGSWEAGVEGALPGIAMLANPISGITYRQEYFADNAEDIGSVISTKESVTVRTQTYNNCLKTYDWTPLEPDVKEYKYYAPGVGQILETNLEGSERIELLSFIQGTS